MVRILLGASRGLVRILSGTGATVPDSLPGVWDWSEFFGEKEDGKNSYFESGLNQAELFWEWVGLVRLL